jgi:hypothetical protein
MEREDFLALLDLMRSQETCAPPPIDRQKFATALVMILSPERDGFVPCRNEGRSATLRRDQLGGLGALAEKPPNVRPAVRSAG